MTDEITSESAGKHMSRPMRAVFKEDLERGLYQPEGLVRLDGKVKHPTLVITEDTVYGCASGG